MSILKYILILILTLSTSSIVAQQNLFNIPSGDITPKSKFFYQHQLNLYSAYQYESKMHFCYGLTNRVEIGVNYINLPINVRSRPVFTISQNSETPGYPILMGTMQVSILHHKSFNLNAGGQYGYTLPSSKPRWCSATYLIGNFNYHHRFKLCTGVIYQNQTMVGRNQWSAMLGYEVKITKRFFLMGDFISGQNSTSSSVIGGFFNCSKRVQLCAGYLVPFPNENNKHGLVLEINILGYDASF